MSSLAIIALVFSSVIFSLFTAVYFIRFGEKITRRKERAMYFDPCIESGFTQRMPWQGTTYPETQVVPTFEENLRKHGRAVAYIKGKEVK